MEFIVFGIGEIDLGIGVMLGELLFERDELVAFFGITGDGEASDREFEAEGEFDGGDKDGVIAEDLFQSVGVLGVFSDADASLSIIRKFWAAEEEGIDLIELDAVEVDLSDHEVEALGFELLLDSKDLVKGASLFGISDFKGEGHELDFGFFDLLGESVGGAVDPDFDLSTEGHSLGILEFVEDSSADIFDKALKLDGMTRFTEVGTAFVAGVRGKQGAIGGEDMKGKKAQEVDDLNKDLRDLDIGIFS